MSEATIQSGLQTIIQGMAAFANADVVVNDWGILDGAVSAAPFVIISNADNFVGRRDTTTPNTVWEVAVTLYEAFTEWATTLDNFRTRRQAIIDELDSGDNRSANGLEGVTIDEIRNEGPIEPYYGPYITADEIPEAIPQFLTQTWILTCEEF